MAEEIIYGVNPVKEALRGSRRAFELFVAQNAADQRLEKIVRLAEERGIPVRQRQRQDLSRLCGSEHHQGVALRIEEFAYAELDEILATWRQGGEPGLLVILDGIQDPHNLGALLRTAACAGANGVIIPKDRAVGVTAVVEKSAAGAADTIPVARVTNVTAALALLKEAGFWIYGAAVEGAGSIYAQKFSGHVALVIGGEGEGIRPLVRKQCDVLFKIPLLGGVASLNASVAGGVALFEVVRQRLAAAPRR
jgi:23S rRNA (guanosine2251-2'-O)-methyltransferase